MELLLLSVLINSLIVFFLTRSFFSNYAHNKKFAYSIGVLSLVYLVYELLQVFWLFNIYEYSLEDLIFANFLIFVFQALVCYSIVRLYVKNNLTTLMFILYIISLIFVGISPLNFVMLASIVSFLFGIVIFFNILDSKSEILRKTAFAFIGYYFFGTFLLVSLLLNFDNKGLFYSIIHTLFLIVVYFLNRDFKDSFNLIPKTVRHKHVFTRFVKYFIFFIAFMSMILISTLGLHEFGHVYVAKYYGCEARAIFFQTDSYPYSEITCNDVSIMNTIALAGPMISFLFAILLFFVDNSIVRSTALISAGFTLISSYADFKEVNFSEGIILTFTVSGVLFLIIGLVYLSKFIFTHQTREHNSII